MRGLLVKEWYLQRFDLITGSVLIIVLGYVNPILLLLFLVFSPLAPAVYPILSLNRDAVSHFDRWYPTMPVKRSSYADLYYLIITVLTAVLTLLMVLLFMLISDGAFSFGAISAMLVLCLMMPTVYLPVTFRFGLAAGRVAALVMLLPEILLMISFANSITDFSPWQRWIMDCFYGNKQEIGMLFAAGTVLAFICSRMLSVRALRRAEY